MEGKQRVARGKGEEEGGRLLARLINRNTTIHMKKSQEKTHSLMGVGMSRYHPHIRSSASGFAFLQLPDTD